MECNIPGGTGGAERGIPHATVWTVGSAKCPRHAKGLLRPYIFAYLTRASCGLSAAASTMATFGCQPLYLLHGISGALHTNLVLTGHMSQSTGFLLRVLGFGHAFGQDQSRNLAFGTGLDGTFA